MNAGIVWRPPIKHGGQLGKRPPRFPDGDHRGERFGRDRLRRRNDDRPRLAARQRRRRFGAHGDSKVGRALRPLRMNQAVDSDCPIPIKPAGKGLRDVPSQHQFA